MLFVDIETTRLHLKNISMEDRDFIYYQFSDDAVNRYLFDAKPMSDANEADELIRFYLQPEPRAQHRWILTRKTDGVKMGTCGFHCWNRKDGSVEVGYDLKQEFWGQGYVSEAMMAIIAFARESMDVKTISACISVDNQKSIRVVEKLGFMPTGLEMLEFRGTEYPHRRYVLTLL